MRTVWWKRVKTLCLWCLEHPAHLMVLIQSLFLLPNFHQCSPSIQTDVNVAVAVKVCKAENEPADMQLILQEARKYWIVLRFGYASRMLNHIMRCRSSICPCNRYYRLNKLLSNLTIKNNLSYFRRDEELQARAHRGNDWSVRGESHLVDTRIGAPWRGTVGGWEGIDWSRLQLRQYLSGNKGVLSASTQVRICISNYSRIRYLVDMLEFLFRYGAYCRFASDTSKHEHCRCSSRASCRLQWNISTRTIMFTGMKKYTNKYIWTSQNNR